MVQQPVSEKDGENAEIGASIVSLPPPPPEDAYPPDSPDVFLNRTWHQQFLESRVSFGEDATTARPSLASLTLKSGDEIVHTRYESLEVSFERVPWNLPISWHGNGCGKWIFIMTLDALSWQCPVVAQLTSTLVRDQVMKDQEVMNKIEAMQKRRWDDVR